MQFSIKFKWYLQRLRVMEAREILHRMREQFTLVSLYVKYLIGYDRSNSSHAIEFFSFCSAIEPQLPTLKWKFEHDTLIIKDLLSGKWQALGFSWRWRSTGNIWHDAPDTHNTWSSSFFNSISCRPDNPYGDIRVAWEPSRLTGPGFDVGVGIFWSTLDTIESSSMTGVEVLIAAMSTNTLFI